MLVIEDVLWLGVDIGDGCSVVKGTLTERRERKINLDGSTNY